MFSQGDQISGMISRADVAEVCIQALQHPSANNATFEVVETQGKPVDDWAAMFASLRPDR
jgi:hypothetical protein